VVVRLYCDETVGLRLDEIVANLNRLAPRFRFSRGKARFSVASDVVTYPETYETLDHRISEESAPGELTILFTEKPYDNNYFWEAHGNKTILSLFAWDQLTDLSRNNGAVYFICALLVRGLGLGVTHREVNTGCINDFWRDKRGVDRGMRLAYVCESCMRHTRQSREAGQTSFVTDIQTVLDDLSSASLSARDICDVWAEIGENADAFDVFLCHNSEDKASVREMNEQLRGRNIRTWLDEEQLPPGRPWQDLLEQQIQSVRTAAILVGSSGCGPWQNIEVRSFLQEFARRQCPIIPVILKDCGSVPSLPLFLGQLTWVDFRKSTPDPFERLLWGITGRRR
jgi:hypothetical protein